MNKKIILQLKKLNAIQPDEAFTRRSRKKILAIKNNRSFRFPVFARWAIAGSVSFIILIIAILVPFTFSPSEQVPKALSAEVIKKEYDNLSINIQLKEINYDQTAQQTISSAIDEITSNRAGHLNVNVLETESAGIININDTTDLKINNLLDEVIN